MTSSSHSSKASGVFSWRGYFRKLFKTSVFKYIIEFKGASSLALAFTIFVKHQTQAYDDKLIRNFRGGRCYYRFQKIRQ
jgi:hypothetical protein